MEQYKEVHSTGRQNNASETSYIKHVGLLSVCNS